MLVTKDTYIAILRATGLKNFPIPTNTDREVAFVAPYNGDPRDPRIGTVGYRAFWTNKVSDSGDRLFNVGFDQGAGIEPPAFGLGEMNHVGLAFRADQPERPFVDESHAHHLEAERQRDAARRRLEMIRGELESLGFGSDEPISGGDCVEAIDLLYQRVFVRDESAPEPLPRAAALAGGDLRRFRILYTEDATLDSEDAPTRRLYECDAEEVSHAIEQFLDEPTNRAVKIIAVDLADGSKAAGPLLRNADGSYELVDNSELGNAWIRNGDVALNLWSTHDAVVIDVHAAGCEADERHERLAVDRKSLADASERREAPGP